MIYIEKFCDIELKTNEKEFKMNHLGEVIIDKANEDDVIVMAVTYVKDDEYDKEFISGNEFNVNIITQNLNCNGEVIGDLVDNLGDLKLCRIITKDSLDHIHEINYIFTKGNVDVESFLTRYVENELLERIEKLEKMLKIKE